MTDATVPDMPDFLRRAAPAAPSTPPAREPRQKRRTRKEPALGAEYSGNGETANPYKQMAEAARKVARENKPRKLRAVKKAGAKKAAKERAAPDMVKVTLKQYADMVSVEPRVFLKVHSLLSGLGKPARAKVLAELGKVLG